MSKKTIKMNKDEIDTLPQNKPVVYKIKNKNEETIYVGIAGRNNVRDRIKDHLLGNTDAVPGGVKVQIEQMPSIDDAKKKEQNIISRTKPKYNKTK